MDADATTGGANPPTLGFAAVGETATFRVVSVQATPAAEFEGGFEADALVLISRHGEHQHRFRPLDHLVSEDDTASVYFVLPHSALDEAEFAVALNGVEHALRAMPVEATSTTRAPTVRDAQLLLYEQLDGVTTRVETMRAHLRRGRAVAASARSDLEDARTRFDTALLAYRADIRRLESELEAATVALRDRESDHNAVRRALESARERVAELESEATLRSGRIRELTAEVDQSDRAVSERDDRLAQLSADLSDAMVALHARDEALADEKREHEDTQAVVASQEQALSAAVERGDRIEEELGAARAALDAEREMLAAIRGELDESHKELAAEGDTVARIREELDLARTTSAEIEADRDEHAARAEALANKLDNAHSATEELERKLGEALAVGAQEGARAAEIEAERDEAAAYAESVRIELDEARDRVVELEREIASTNALNEQREELATNDAADNLRLRIAELETELAEVRGVVEKTEADRHGLSARGERLEAELATLRDELQASLDSLTAVRRELSEAQALEGAHKRADSSDERIEQLVVELNEARDQLNETRDQLIQAKAEVEQRRAGVEAAGSGPVQQDDERAALERELAAERARHEQTAARLAAAERVLLSHAATAPSNGGAARGNGTGDSVGGVAVAAAVAGKAPDVSAEEPDHAPEQSRVSREALASRMASRGDRELAEAYESAIELWHRAEADGVDNPELRLIVEVVISEAANRPAFVEEAPADDAGSGRLGRRKRERAQERLRAAVARARAGVAPSAT